MSLFHGLHAGDGGSFGEDENEHLARSLERVTEPGFDLIEPTCPPQRRTSSWNLFDRRLATGRDAKLFQNDRAWTSSSFPR